MTEVEQSSIHFLMSQDIDIKDSSVVSKDISIIDSFLRASAGVNDSRMDGFTPLHLAVQSGKEESVKLLLDCGARLDNKDLFGKTPLHLAACIKYRNEYKMCRIANLLLNAATDPKVFSTNFFHNNFLFKKFINPSFFRLY